MRDRSGLKIYLLLSLVFSGFFIACQSPKIGEPCTTTTDCGFCAVGQQGSVCAVGQSAFCDLVPDNERIEGFYGICEPFTEEMWESQTTTKAYVIEDWASFALFKEIVDVVGLQHFTHENGIVFRGVHLEGPPDGQGNPTPLTIHLENLISATKISFARTGIDHIRLDAYQEGELHAHSNASLQTISAPALLDAFSTTFTGNEALHTLDLGSLANVTEDLSIQNNASLETLSLNALDTVAIIHIENNASFGNLSLPQLNTVDILTYLNNDGEGIFQIGQAAEETFVRRQLRINDNDGLTDIMAPVLVRVGGEHLNLAEITPEDGWLRIRNNSQLTQFRFPGLQEIFPGGMEVRFNPLLDTCDRNTFLIRSFADNPLEVPSDMLLEALESRVSFGLRLDARDNKACDNGMGGMP